jgi:hypothetical protein
MLPPMRQTIALLLLGLAVIARADEPAKATDARAEAAAGVDAAQLLKRARQIERKTSQLRGLRLRRPIAMGVLSRQQILTRIERKLAKEYSAEEIRDESAVLKRLGLLPASMDYRATLLELLKEQVAGYYDPAEGKLHLADWISISLQEIALSHEICHGLQDQHFGLKRFTKPIKDNSDQQLAQAALVEGDCTGVIIEYSLAPQGLDLGSVGGAIDQLAKQVLSSGGSPRIKAAPRFLRDTLLFPYLSGLSMIQRVRAKHPWATVSKMFQRPPESTEQVLHPEKYWTIEHPVSIHPKPLSSLAAYTKTKQDVLGELQLSIYLAQGVSDDVAARAAAGWGGDVLQAFRKDKDALPLVVHLTTWDSEADALEFANAQRHVFVARKLKARATEDGQPTVYLGKGGEEWSVELRRHHVLVLHAAPAALRAALQQEVWAGWRVGGRKITRR